MPQQRTQDGAQLVKRLTKKPGAMLMLVRLYGAAKGIFLPELTVGAHCLRCSTNSCVQSCASALACMSKIPNNSSHTIAWTHKTAHTLVRVGSAVRVAAVALPR